MPQREAVHDETEQPYIAILRHHPECTRDDVSSEFKVSSSVSVSTSLPLSSAERSTGILITLGRMLKACVDHGVLESTSIF